jgi:hypothetical protein
MDGENMAVNFSAIFLPASLWRKGARRSEQHPKAVIALCVALVAIPSASARGSSGRH